ncbi:MAG: hypothetical protein ACYSU7_04310 [Planctomycetota bacterium]
MSERFELTVAPECGRWCDLLADPPAGRLLSDDLAEWRRRTRFELGLPVDRPVVATGHQTLLWHPGILVKYFAVNSFAGDRRDFAVANLIVDQHTGDFGRFDVPVRREDGTLASRSLTLTTARPGVPMVDHPAFSPPDVYPDLNAAIPSVAAGVERIVTAVAAHREQPNAARQMAAALDDLMSPWVAPMPGVGSSDLMGTSLGAALLRAMADDPQRCAATYNAAVRSVPDSGIPELEVTPDAVDLPLWRLNPDGRREHANESDARRCLDEGCRCTEGRCRLLPRALLLTALVRLGMCDLFIHGTGGANYDRAMERWLEHWLGIRPAPIAVATATLRLPLDGSGPDEPEVAAALHAARRARHDPETAADLGGGSPGAAKRAMLAAIDEAPRRSPERLALFLKMQEQLAALRERHAAPVIRAEERANAARQHAAEAPIARRRDWPFPLYPQEMIDALADAVCRERVGT